MLEAGGHLRRCAEEALQFLESFLGTFFLLEVESKSPP